MNITFHKTKKMKHLHHLPNIKTILIAGGLCIVGVPLLNSCKTSGKNAGSKTMNRSSMGFDTSRMQLDTTDKGGQTNGGTDKKP